MYTDVTAFLIGASLIKEDQEIILTTLTAAALHTATLLHAPVHCPLQHDNFRRTTLRAEILVATIFCEE